MIGANSKDHSLSGWSFFWIRCQLSDVRCQEVALSWRVSFSQSTQRCRGAALWVDSPRSPREILDPIPKSSNRFLFFFFTPLNS